MSFSPDWGVIGQLDQQVPQPIIDEVTEILFAPDPAPNVLAQIEVCVVLGSRNCGYKARRAAQLFGENEQAIFVACGANLSDAGPPEAELIRNILLENGVGAGRLLVDEHSTDTVANLRHAERLVAGHVADPRSKNIAIVSSGFHRRHVLASRPASLEHAIYVSATGPLAGRDTWHTNTMGRAVILHELRRPGFVCDRVPALSIATF